MCIPAEAKGLATIAAAWLVMSVCREMEVVCLCGWSTISLVCEWVERRKKSSATGAKILKVNNSRCRQNGDKRGAAVIKASCQPPAQLVTVVGRRTKQTRHQSMTLPVKEFLCALVSNNPNVAALSLAGLVCYDAARQTRRREAAEVCLKKASR